MTKLPIWDGKGHLSDAALVALADGQHAIVEEEAQAHAESCEACAAKLSELALESVAVGVALVHAAAAERAEARFPSVAVAVAVLLGLIGTVPTLLEGRWSAAVLDAPHWLATFGAAMVSAFHTFFGSPIGTAAMFASAALLVFSGALVARQQRAAHASPSSSDRSITS
jgi:hypothetical protein